jgi:hypothetical protein
MKPLGRKSYGSIPHLPGSRLGPGDHHCHAGQDAICMEKARDRHDRIIAKCGGEVLALTRAGYLATTSPYEQHHLFAVWVRENYARFAEMLHEGQRVNGEWLAMAHGTRYELVSGPFVAFDMMAGGGREAWDYTVGQCAAFGLPTAAVLSDGPPVHIDAIKPLIERSAHGAVDPVEGAVWRVERKGRFDFIAKWVRPDKVDGKYLPEISGTEPIWHWRPTKAAA